MWVNSSNHNLYHICVWEFIKEWKKLWSMDAAGRVPHWSPTQPDAGCSVRCGCPHVGAAFELFFFFFFFFFHKFVPTWLDSRQLGFNSHRFTPHQADLARIGPYWPNWVVRPATKIGLESCRNSRNQLWIRSKHLKSVLPQFYSEYLLLLLCFLFCFLFLAFFFCFVNQGIVMYFLRIF